MATRRVPFLDLSIPNDQERNELLAAIDGVFRHGRIVLGPEVTELEARLAARCGRAYAVGVNSGTDALFLALKAARIGPGDEVVTTSLSWIATTNAIALTGATPVFADIGNDLNLDVDSVASALTPATKVILPVHYTGKVCDMTRLMKLAETSGVMVIEDACQAFGAKHKGRTAGSFGEMACFSMNPMKVLAACGEAGAVVTDGSELNDRLISLRYNGTVNREMCIEPSLNGRLDTLQAAILLRRLGRVDGLVARRRELANRYNAQLSGVVQTPSEQPGDSDVWYTYTIQADRRDDLKAFLEERGIETKIQHPFLMPEQPAYKEHARGTYPNARRIGKRVLCLPIHEKLADSDVDYVSEQVAAFFGTNR